MTGTASPLMSHHHYELKQAATTNLMKTPHLYCTVTLPLTLTTLTAYLRVHHSSTLSTIHLHHSHKPTITPIQHSYTLFINNTTI